MFDWFRKKKRSTGKATTYAPNTRIPYDESLVVSLTEEHQKLLTIFGKISEASTKNNSREVKKQLAIFKDLLRSHLLKENTLLYIYLKHVTKSDESTNNLIVDMQQEMGTIGGVVFNFVKKWSDSSVGVYGSQFENELSNIGETLIRRIENEERNLYTIYKHPSYYSG